MKKKKRNCILAGVFVLACGLLLLLSGKRPQEQGIKEPAQGGITKETEAKTEPVSKEEDKGEEKQQDETSRQDRKDIRKDKEPSQNVPQEETEIMITPEGDTVTIKENPVKQEKNADTGDREKPGKGETEIPDTEKTDAREPVDGGKAELPFIPAE